MKQPWLYRRGDVYLVDLGTRIGSEQRGIRPVVVVQNDTGNFHSPTLIVVPLTTKIQKDKRLPVHCILKNVTGLESTTLVLAEQILTIDKSRILEYKGHVSLPQLKEISKCLSISLAL